MDFVMELARSALSTVMSLLGDTDDPYHFFVEIGLGILVIVLLFHKSYKDVQKDSALTDKEIDELCSEWKPEPLVSTKKSKSKEKRKKKKQPNSSDTDINEEDEEDEEDDDEIDLCHKIIGPVGSTVIVEVDGEERKCINLASLSMLQLQCHPKVIAAGINSIQKYGVGACGPRGFYGSIDKHMILEESLAEFMGVEEAVLFSASFATLSSVVPAFSSRGDYLLLDKAIGMASKLGASLSRSHVLWFEHNDMDHLGRLLSSLAPVFEQKKQRIFVVVEALYHNIGDICPLPELLKLKKRFPFRIILDESLSIGVLGKSGRGITEYYGVPVQSVEIICGSLGSSLGGLGGFSCGSKIICSHQRLNCQGYVFSCSLPPFQAASADKALEIIKKEGRQLVSDLRSINKQFNRILSKLTILRNVSDPLSPIKHLQLASSLGSRKKNNLALKRIVKEVFEKNDIILTRSKYVKKEVHKPTPSIRLTVSLGHTKAQLEKAMRAIEQASVTVLQQF